MSFVNPRSPAEASDSLATVTAAAMAFAALIYSVNVIEVFAPDSSAGWLGYFQIGAAVVLIAVFAPLIFFLKSKGGRSAGKSAAAGYLSALFRQAALTAFSLTLAFMVLLSLFDRMVLSRLSAEAAIDLVITFALAIFAVSFFIINRFSRLDDGHGDEM
jgi:hypothetical protein